MKSRYGSFHKNMQALLHVFFVCLQKQSKTITMAKTKTCIVCQKSDKEIPLIKFQFKGNKHHICSQHIPILIHKAQELESILPGVPPSEE